MRSTEQAAHARRLLPGRQAQRRTFWAIRRTYIQDIRGLSHKVQEWTNDPFVNNSINPWLTPTAPQYGCTNALETDDPVVGYGFAVKMSNGVTYHPEDEVFYSWFARQKPSISSAGSGVYTYLNNFADVAHGC